MHYVECLNSFFIGHPIATDMYMQVVLRKHCVQAGEQIDSIMKGQVRAGQTIFIYVSLARN